jgi:methylmalonyl-CoA mutase cobalamin-binding subunit
VTLEFTPEGIRRLAQIAFEVNERTENIGARRLATVMEHLLDEVSFDATEPQRPDRDHGRAYVTPAGRAQPQRGPVALHPAMTDLSAEFQALAAYRPTHKVRFVTAASLFDGHDAAINIMRRILQGMGAEVIHLGHNRSVDEVVTAALQEDVQGIAISSYQGGHVEYFKYMVDLLRAAAASTSRSSAAAAASSCRPRSANCRPTAWRASTAPRTASAWAWPA